MSKRKKIFHKPQEEVPSAEDILNYLKEDSVPPLSPKKKSSPSGGTKKRSVKLDLDESSLEDGLSLKEKKYEETEEVMKSAPAPSMESFSKSLSNSKEVKNQKDKQKYELEKAMLSVPLISDAVEGYALFEDRKIAKSLIEDINHKIASQTGKKDNRIVVFRIAAMLLIFFLISGGAFYLFDQISENKLAEMSSGNSKQSGNSLSDSSAVANKIAPGNENNPVNDLALEREEVAKEKDESKTLEYKPGNSDGYITEKKVEAGPLDERVMNGTGTGITTGSISTISSTEEEEVKDRLNSPVVPGERSIQADSTVVRSYNSNLAYGDDVDQLQEQSQSDLKSASQRSRESKAKKSKVKEDASTYYTPSAKPQQELLDKTEVSGASRKGYLLEDGIRLYNQEKYREAKEVLLGVLATQPSNQEAIFYAGLSEYKLRNYQAALSNLSKVVPASRRYDEARWNIAQIYLETGKKEEAKALLKELSKNSNSYSEKAFEELKKME